MQGELWFSSCFINIRFLLPIVTWSYKLIQIIGFKDELKLVLRRRLPRVIIYHKRKKRVLTVQEDVVRLAPPAPQWRLIQAGTTGLDGVVNVGLENQRKSGFFNHRLHLETEDKSER